MTDSVEGQMAIAGLPTPAEDQIVSIAPGDHAGAKLVQEWLGAYAVSRDPILRERIVLAYLGLADRLAQRFRCSRGTTLEDLTQTARAALIAAVDRYDPSRQQSFVPFAIACVVGELKRYLRDATWRLHVPRQLKERSLNLSKALEELPQPLGRFPTIAELAAHLAVTEEEALEALDVAHTRIACSLDEPLGEVDDGSLADLVAAPEPFEQLEDLLLLLKLLADLPETERKVIVLRFFAELSQDEIAARIGFSQMQVSRLLRRAIARMRAQLMPGGPAAPAGQERPGRRRARRPSSARRERTRDAQDWRGLGRGDPAAQGRPGTPRSSPTARP